MEAVHGALNKLPTYIPIVHPVMFYVYGRGLFYCLTLDRRTAEVDIGPPNRLPETHLLFTLWVFYLYSLGKGRAYFKLHVGCLVSSSMCRFLSAIDLGNASSILNNRLQLGNNRGSVAWFDTILLVLHYPCSTV